MIFFRFVGFFILFLIFNLYGKEETSLEELLGIKIQNRILKGIDRAAIIVNPKIFVESLKLKIKREDGWEKDFFIKEIKEGEERQFFWQQDEGRFNYTAFFKLNLKGKKEKDFGITFEILCKKPMEIKISKRGVSLEKRNLSFEITEKAGRAELWVYGANNKLLSYENVQFNGEPPNTKLSVRWHIPDETITLIKLKVYDVDEFFAGMDITPFFVEIPHREVSFDFGKWKIKKEEEEKLIETLKNITDAIDKYGNELEIKLYIAGYTDSVDTKEFNKILSEKRAREIGKYLRKKGLEIPIFYQGFGEDVLAIPTPDETPEEKNRRAIYIIANQPPPYSSTIPKDEWKVLK